VADLTRERALEVYRMMLLIGRFEERVAACFAGNEIPGFIHLEWRKAVGERVSPGETLLVIETEKAEVEVESPAGVTVVEVLGASGTSRPVGDVIAIIEA
jgi:biotin carboxyl carrier protein